MGSILAPNRVIAKDFKVVRSDAMSDRRKNALALNRRNTLPGKVHAIKALFVFWLYYARY